MPEKSVNKINRTFGEKPFLLYLLLLFSGFTYYLLAYQTARDNFIQVISLFTFLFVSFYIVSKVFSITNFKYLFIAGILFRILLLFSIPNLSDDVYRFIWDGRLAANGINPFSHLPSEIMQMQPVAGITKELFSKLNSPEHYTIYPPMLQGIFWVAAKLIPDDIYATIVFFKCTILLFEIGTSFLLLQLLKKLSLSMHLSLLYILNPLVITELTGNVHFDGVMIFFVVLTFLLLYKKKWQMSAISLAVGIAAKLIPVLFLPLIVLRLDWKKGLLYSAITAVVTLSLFALLFDIATIQHLLNSVDLFFRHFEFNASIYYFVRWVGAIVTGYNLIAFAGPLLMLVSAGIILLISFRGKKDLSQIFINRALFIIATWFLFSTTVHPWYICLPVALAVFTPYRFAIIWSFTATVSYAAYHSNPVKENLLLLAAGYLFMIGYAAWEIKNKKQNQSYL